MNLSEQSFWCQGVAGLSTRGSHSQRFTFSSTVMHLHLDRSQLKHVEDVWKLEQVRRSSYHHTDLHVGVPRLGNHLGQLPDKMHPPILQSSSKGSKRLIHGWCVLLRSTSMMSAAHSYTALIAFLFAERRSAQKRNLANLELFNR